jgi:hypothetical protein
VDEFSKKSILRTRPSVKDSRGALAKARIAIAAAILCGVASAAAQDLSIEISPDTQDVRQGAAPRFEVTVRANAPVRIVDLARRPDLRETLARPRLSGTGDAADAPIRLREGGTPPPAESDYITLGKGNSLRYEFDGSPLYLPWLPPGRYFIQLRLRPDFDKAFVESNRVSFTVVEAR